MSKPMTAEDHAAELDDVCSRRFHDWLRSSLQTADWRVERRTLFREAIAEAELRGARKVLTEVFALVAERVGGTGTAQGHVYSAALLDLSDKYQEKP